MYKRQIQAAKKGDFDKADEFIKQANEGLVNAHNVQTDMLTQEAQGNLSLIHILLEKLDSLKILQGLNP